MKLLLFLLLAGWLLPAQTPDPAHDPLEKGYAALRSGDHSAALDHFLEAARLAPRRAAVRKELGYVYLKLGEPEFAREMFAQALALDPEDHHTALQLAFSFQSAGEAKRAVELLEGVRQAGGPAEREQAKKALAAVRRGSGVLGARADEAATPVQAALSAAYAAMGRKDYEAAIDYFQTAAREEPRRVSIRKELGYAYLKIGETEWARDVFEQAYVLEPGDDRGGLELAYLRFETGQRALALELFRKLRQADDRDVRASAAETARRVEAELSREIARWEEGVGADPGNWSAHQELAGLYGEYGDPQKAAKHYEAAWRIQPPRREEMLLRLARVRGRTADTLGARGAWLLASYSKDTRISETGREQLPERFPYASEFEAALDLDPRNTTVRRDLAYLLLEVGELEAALREFERVIENDPDDLLAAAQLAFIYLERRNAAGAVELLEKARTSTDEDVARRAREALERVRQARARPHRDLGQRSFERSYLNDARLAFLRAYEEDPEDYSVALKLGVVFNLLKQDREAIRWFKIASQSDDAEVSEQAAQSYRNLAPQFRRITTTLWTYPFFSTRYKDVFNYAQLKTEFRFDSLPIRPYLSLRFVGDLRQRTGGQRPQFLSESSLIAGVGVRTPTYRGLTLWGEAGEAISYLSRRPAGVPRAAPDYRGGVNWIRNVGATLGGRESGAFFETNIDGVFISRFDNNAIAYWQFRPGYRLADRGALKAQVFWNFNATVDVNRAYWANYVETGPGVRLRVPGVSPPMDFMVQVLRGVHLVNEFNPRRPNYWDVRVSLWYSFAR